MFAAGSTRLLFALPLAAVPFLSRQKQFHPEFKSRPGRASPPFLGFILASGKRLNSYLTSRQTPQPSPMATPVKPSAQTVAQLGLDNLSLSAAGAALASGTSAAGSGAEGGSSAKAALFMAG